MPISHIDHSHISTPNYPIKLSNILHVPMAHRNLVLVHHLTDDNNVYVEFHPNCFFLLRIGQWRNFFKGNVRQGCTHWWQLPTLPWTNKLSPVSRPLRDFGIVNLVILPPLLFSVLYTEIIFLSLLKRLSSMFSILVKKVRAISFLFLFQLMYPVLL